MAGDPLIQLGKLRAIAMSQEIEKQLANLRGCKPVLAMLDKARHEAADAMVALAIVDPEKPADIRALQNEVKRFDDLVRWVREMIDEGLEADRELSQQERDEWIDTLSQSPEARSEAAELGLDQSHYDE